MGNGPIPQREDPERTLQRLLPNVPEMVELRDTLIDRLENNILGKGESHELSLAEFAKTAATFKIDDYRDLCGMLRACRDSKDAPRVLQKLEDMTRWASVGIPHLSNAAFQLIDLYNSEPARSGDPSIANISMGASIAQLHESDRDFATDAIMVMRSVYPFGLNVLNANWEPGRPSALLPGEILRLSYDSTMNRDVINIVSGARPSEPTLVTVPDFGTIQLREGQSVLLGNPLALTKLFGIRIEPLIIDGRVPLESHYSRASILIVRDYNQTFVFDRASRTRVAMAKVASNGTMSVGTFDPGPDGSGRAGRSIWEVPRDPDDPK